MSSHSFILMALTVVALALIVFALTQFIGPNRHALPEPWYPRALSVRRSQMRGTILNVQIPTALNAAIESAAAADGLSVNDWVVNELERAVPQQLLGVARRSEETAQRKADEARRISDIVNKMKPH
jgi:hypothetical protein